MSDEAGGVPPRGGRVRDPWAVGRETLAMNPPTRRQSRRRVTEGGPELPPPPPRSAHVVGPVVLLVGNVVLGAVMILAAVGMVLGVHLVVDHDRFAGARDYSEHQFFAVLGTVAYLGAFALLNGPLLWLLRRDREAWWVALAVGSYVLPAVVVIGPDAFDPAAFDTL